MNGHCSKTSSIRRINVFFIFLILLPVVSAHARSAAEELFGDRVRVVFDSNQKARGLIIEGVIEKGDADTFLELVKFYKGEIGDVHIMSPGGNVLEAMKIGRIIRSLKMHVYSPFRVKSRPYCVNSPNKPENCTCASACFLIYVAGTYRFGETLGIHRAYLNHEQLKNLSEKDALTASKEIKKAVESYLHEMGVPASYIERAMSTPSGKIDFLNKDEIEKYFTGYIHEYAEWITAKCGDTDKLHREEAAVIRNSKYANTTISIQELALKDPKVAAAQYKWERAIDCRRKIDNELRIEAYRKLYQ